MSRRKVLWKRRAAQSGGGEQVYRVVPAKRVLGTGRRAYANSPRPNSGVGVTVTEPMGPRKRQLVDKWAASK